MTTIAVIGPPGAGKDTQIARAEKEITTMISIATGNLLREKGFNLSDGNLISDEVVMKILKEELEHISNSTNKNIVVLNGAPRNLQQAELLERERIKVDLVLKIELTEEDAVKRAAERIVCKGCQATYTLGSFNPPKRKGICDKCGGTLGKRSDDNEETVRKRMRIYCKETKPVIDWYAKRGIPIETSATGEEFIQLIRSC